MRMPKQNRVLAAAVKRANKLTPAQRKKLAENAAKAREAAIQKAYDDANYTPLQEAFILEYPKDYNATRAYWRASASVGRCCSMLAASSSASRLLTHDKIKNAVAVADAERKERYQVTPKRILEEIAKMAFTTMDDFTFVDQDGQLVTDFRGASKEQMAAVTEVQIETMPIGENEDGSVKYMTKTKFKLSNKQGALELLARTQKMLVDRKEVTGADGAPLHPPAINVHFVKPPDHTGIPGAPAPKQLEAK